MAREKGLLSDLQLRHWIKAGTPLAKADGNGLTFTLSTAGVAGWIRRYRHGGRRRELTIGRYPDIGLADARGTATIKRAEIMQGRNPAADKQKAKATAAKDWTVRELVKDYRAKKLVSLAHSTQVSYGRHLKRVEKKLGALTAREIEASTVVALIEASSRVQAAKSAAADAGQVTVKAMAPRRSSTRMSAGCTEGAAATRKASGNDTNSPALAGPSGSPQLRAYRRAFAHPNVGLHRAAQCIPGDGRPVR